MGTVLLRRDPSSTQYESHAPFNRLTGICFAKSNFSSNAGPAAAAPPFPPFFCCATGSEVCSALALRLDEMHRTDCRWAHAPAKRPRGPAARAAENAHAPLLLRSIVVGRADAEIDGVQLPPDRNYSWKSAVIRH